MKIGILGTGHIGKTLALKLPAAGHDVKVANSRGPETIGADVLASGARAVSAAEAVKDVDVVILSIPLNRIPSVAPLVADLPAETVVIDTSNYYPFRDGKIDAIEAGQVESLWVAEQLGRPVVKAWNSIGSDSFARKGTAAGEPGSHRPPRRGGPGGGPQGGDAARRGHRVRRVRRGHARRLVAAAARCPLLLHRPHGRGDGPALAAADRTEAPKRRDLIIERLTASGGPVSGDDILELNRTLTR